jgi:hypothetical protein
VAPLTSSQASGARFALWAHSPICSPSTTRALSPKLRNRKPKPGLTGFRLVVWCSCYVIGRTAAAGPDRPWRPRSVSRTSARGPSRQSSSQSIAAYTSSVEAFALQVARRGCFRPTRPAWTASKRAIRDTINAAAMSPSGQAGEPSARASVSLPSTRQSRPPTTLATRTGSAGDRSPPCVVSRVGGRGKDPLTGNCQDILGGT